MTEIKDKDTRRKDQDLKVLLAPGGRQLYFTKECVEAVTIHRKVNDGDWEIISKNTHPPYIDDDQFDLPVVLAYKAVFEEQRRSENVVEVHLS